MLYALQYREQIRALRLRVRVRDTVDIYYPYRYVGSCTEVHYSRYYKVVSHESHESHERLRGTRC